MSNDAESVARGLTEAQRRALRWFYKRGGDGCFTRGQVLLARGELAAVGRKTWNALASSDPPLIAYSGGNRYKRATITQAGIAFALTNPGEEARTVEDEWDD